MERATGSEQLLLDITDQNVLNERDAAVWRARWKCQKYHHADKDEIVPLDRETLPLLRRALSGSSESLRKLTDLFKRRAQDRFDPYDLARADRMRNLKPEHLRHAMRILPDEVSIVHGNLLMYGGVSCLWQTLIGNGTASAGQALTYFNNSQAAMGVGDSSTAAAATQTNLQASTNKLRVAMDATYPVHTDATTSGAATISFKSTFSSGQANYAWEELAIFNSTTDAVGRMLNRKVASHGTKASGSWAMTMQITIS